MSSGGARARSGPAPQQYSVRNGRAGADWVRLPASGRKADAPDWPLPRPTRRERALWAEYWRKPQALMWEANGQELEVALHVRTLTEAEQRGVWQKKGAAGLRNLVKQQLEYLGLSQPGLARNNWTIVDDQAVDAPPSEGGDPDDARPIPISDARDRLRRLVDAG